MHLLCSIELFQNRFEAIKNTSHRTKAFAAPMPFIMAAYLVPSMFAKVYSTKPFGKQLL